MQSLARPGANITGFSYFEPTIGGKWLGLLKEIAPHIRHVALMFNPDSSPYSRLFYPSLEVAAAKLAVEAAMAIVHEPGEIEQAMMKLADAPGGGLIVSPESFNYTNRNLIFELAARFKLPTIYGIPGTAAEGGLLYYCVDIVNSYLDKRQIISIGYFGVRSRQICLFNSQPNLP